MTTLRISLPLFLASCAMSPPGETASAITTTDRAMLQDLIAHPGPNGDVFFPEGDFVVDPPGSSPYCLTAAAVHIHGAGQGLTNIKLIDRAGITAKIFELTGTDTSIDNMTLDGNKANQAISEQSHAVFVLGGSQIRITNVTAQNFPADGFYLSIGASDVVIADSISQNNHRHGITLGATVTGVTISGNQLTGNDALQIDSEPKGADRVTNVTVDHNTLVASTLTTGLYALSVGGAGGGQWSITNNTVTGSIQAGAGNHFVISDNHITATADTAPVEVGQSASDVTITRNTLEQASTLLNSSVVYIEGTATSMPSNVHVTDNQLSVASANLAAFGVRARGAVDVTVTGNTITGPDGTSEIYAAVSCRSTLAGRHFELCAVTDNTINGFGVGVTVSGDKAMGWFLDELDVARNTINSHHGVGPDAKNDAPAALLVAGNMWGPKVVLPHIEPVSSNTRIIASDEPITVVPATP
jgi:hypothetical protein